MKNKTILCIFSTYIYKWKSLFLQMFVYLNSYAQKQ
jgi:hypothetical protein